MKLKANVSIKKQIGMQKSVSQNCKNADKNMNGRIDLKQSYKNNCLRSNSTDKWGWINPLERYNWKQRKTCPKSWLLWVGK